MTQLRITKEAVRRPFQKKRKSCPFSSSTSKIDYKDLKTLTINMDMRTMDCLKDFGSILETDFTKMEKFS